MLTPEQRLNYLNNPGNCPYCGDNDIYIYEHCQIDNEEVTRVLKCGGCREKWTEIYHLVDVQDIQKMEN